MIKLGKKTQYALVALFHLDRVSPGSRASTHDLSLHYDVPEPHLGKVLQKLSRAGILRSVMGVQGGYELARSLEELTLGDVLRALEPAQTRRRVENHTVLRAFPSCYVRGMAREVERNAIYHMYNLPLLELLTDMESTHAPAQPLEASV